MPKKGQQGPAKNRTAYGDSRQTDKQRKQRSFRDKQLPFGAFSYTKIRTDSFHPFCDFRCHLWPENKPRTRGIVLTARAATHTLHIMGHPAARVCPRCLEVAKTVWHENTSFEDID